LVLGIVQVGEVLDLGDRQQPADPQAEAQPEDRLLVGGFMVEVPFYAQRLFAAELRRNEPASRIP